MYSIDFLLLEITTVTNKEYINWQIWELQVWEHQYHCVKSGVRWHDFWHFIWNWILDWKNELYKDSCPVVKNSYRVVKVVGSNLVVGKVFWIELIKNAKNSRMEHHWDSGFEYVSARIFHRTFWIIECVLFSRYDLLLASFLLLFICSWSKNPK